MQGHLGMIQLLTLIEGCPGLGKSRPSVLVGKKVSGLLSRNVFQL